MDQRKVESLTLNDHSEQLVSRIEALLSLWKDAYQCAVISYVGLKTSEGPRLLFGRISLEPSRVGINNELFKFETEHIIAARSVVNAKWSNILLLLAKVKKGGIPAVDGTSIINLEKDGYLSASYDPIHHPLFTEGPRLPCLQIRGISKHSLLIKATDSHQLDWELKAADEPFDNLEELFFQCIMPMTTPTSEQTTLEVVAKSPGIISNGSIIIHGKARIECQVAKALNPKNVRIGYKVIQGGLVTRKSVNGSKLRWRNKDDTKIGVCRVSIGSAPYIQAFLSYKDIALHQWWIVDPRKHLNPRHAIHQVFDKDLEFLKRMLLEPESDKSPAPAFEGAISTLLHLLGFSAVNYGRIPKLQRGPDIIAVTPSGNIGVIECTLGVLDENNKLAKLVQRTKLAKDKLAAAGWGYLKVQSAIVTPLTREEVSADLEKAAKQDIVVICKENIEEMLKRVVLLPDPERLFQEVKALG